MSVALGDITIDYLDYRDWKQAVFAYSSKILVHLNNKHTHTGVPQWVESPEAYSSSFVCLCVIMPRWAEPRGIL